MSAACAQPRAQPEGVSAPGRDLLEIPPLRRGRRLAWLAALVVAVALVGLVVARWRGSQAPVETLRLAAVQRRDVVQRIESLGRLDVATRIEVASPVAGRLVEIAVAPGQRVEEGATLARLDASTTAVALAGARAGLQATAAHTARARAALSALREERTRLEELRRRGLASEQQLSAARAEEVEAEAALRAARAEQAVSANQVAAVELQQQLHQIVAPAAGIVLTAPDRIGASVDPSAGPLFEITDTLDELTIHASLSEREVGQVQPGRSASFSVQAFDERRFEATVERVDLEPQQGSGAVLYPLRLRARNPDGALRPGMTVLVTLEIARLDDALAVPEAALRFAPPGATDAPERSRVFRSVAVGNLQEVRVEPGLSDGAFTAVRVVGDGELSTDDRVAVGLLSMDGARDGVDDVGVSLGEPR